MMAFHMNRVMYVLVYLFIISYESNQRITSITLFYTSIDEITFLFYFMQTESFIYLLEITITLT